MIPLERCALPRSHVIHAEAARRESNTDAAVDSLVGVEQGLAGRLIGFRVNANKHAWVALDGSCRELKDARGVPHLSETPGTGGRPECLGAPEGMVIFAVAVTWIS
jgi:hypothetical protein